MSNIKFKLWECFFLEHINIGAFDKKRNKKNNNKQNKTKQNKNIYT